MLTDGRKLWREIWKEHAMATDSTCSQTSYDSDATVAPEEGGVVETELERQSSLGEEDSCEAVECDHSIGSPSILHPNDSGPGRNKMM